MSLLTGGELIVILNGRMLEYAKRKEIRVPKIFSNSDYREWTEEFAWFKPHVVRDDGIRLYKPSMATKLANKLRVPHKGRLDGMPDA
jgi:hypothetical protein